MNSPQQDSTKHRTPLADPTSYSTSNQELSHSNNACTLIDFSQSTTQSLLEDISDESNSPDLPAIDSVKSTFSFTSFIEPDSIPKADLQLEEPPSKELIDSQNSLVKLNQMKDPFCNVIEPLSIQTNSFDWDNLLDPFLNDSVPTIKEYSNLLLSVGIDSKHLSTALDQLNEAMSLATTTEQQPNERMTLSLSIDEHPVEGILYKTKTNILFLSFENGILSWYERIAKSKSFLSSFKFKNLNDKTLYLGLNDNNSNSFMFNFICSTYCLLNTGNGLEETDDSQLVTIKSIYAIYQMISSLKFTQIHSLYNLFDNEASQRGIMEDQIRIYLFFLFASISYFMNEETVAVGFEDDISSFTAKCFFKMEEMKKSDNLKLLKRLIEESYIKLIEGGYFSSFKWDFLDEHLLNNFGISYYKPQPNEISKVKYDPIIISFIREQMHNGSTSNCNEFFTQVWMTTKQDSEQVENINC